MIDSFYIGATGMGVSQVRLDTIANNISNVNTTAFKKSRVAFEDLYYRRLDALAPLSTTAALDQVGLGAAVARTDAVFTSGDLKETDNPLDIAIKGNGFLEVENANGDRYYSRGGSLRLDADGTLQAASGLNVVGNIRVPADATSITIANDGTVTAVVSNESQPVQLGQLQLAYFVNPGGLRPLGSGLYQPTDLSGQAFLSIPGENGTGTLSQGYLEASNVDLTSELVDLVLAQKAYQLNSRVVQISDDILATIANLHPNA